jgi:hypothetical protein
MESIIAVTAGLFSLLGAFAGAALSRRTDYEKWLREGRSEVFANCLELISEAQKDATYAMRDISLDEHQQNIKVTEAYSPALNYARVVCLYLPKKNRKEFRQLVHEFYALHSTKNLGDLRNQTMTNKLESIQTIFEACL